MLYIFSHLKLALVACLVISYLLQLFHSLEDAGISGLNGSVTTNDVFCQSVMYVHVLGLQTQSKGSCSETTFLHRVEDLVRLKTTNLMNTGTDSLCIL